MSGLTQHTIWQMYYEGYHVHEIAEYLDISEWDVIRVIQPKGY